MRLHLKRLILACFIFFGGMILLQMIPISLNENEVEQENEVKNNRINYKTFISKVMLSEKISKIRTVLYSDRNTNSGPDMIETLFPVHSNIFSNLDLNNQQAANKMKTRSQNYEDNMSVYGEHVLKRINIQLTMKRKNQNQKPILILLYYNDKNLRNKKFESKECNVNNCKFSRKAEDFNRSDVVIFKDVPPYVKRPLSRPSQLWIYYQLESPLHTRPFPHDAMINWTSTFRSDSILPSPYGIFRYKDHTVQKKIKSNNMVAESKTKNNENDKNITLNKTQFVATFVSNCNDKNGRLDYIHKLQNHIKVDIYGRCGPLRCEHHKKCWEMLERNYKFYLSFENSNCKDYITEKLFNALRHNIIPVVMGARVSEYKRIAPPNSFIHVDDYKSPKHLANYLLTLVNNDALYNSYFHWKSQGELLNTNYQCRLCSMVQLIDTNHLFWYKDIRTWWSGNNTCMPISKKWTRWKD